MARKAKRRQPGGGKRKLKRHGKRRGGIGRHLPHMAYAKCGACHRTIFGGSKGMSTHRRRKHRGR